MDRMSPFTPGIPAPVDVFRGRHAEVERLQTVVDRATSGRPQFAFITGERGIGKSSLAAFALMYARRRQNMAGVHAFLGGCHTVDQLVRRTLDELLAASQEQSWFERAKSLFGRVQNVGLFGVDVRIAANDDEIRAVGQRFPAALKSLTEKLSEAKDEPKSGVVIILDDLNGLSAQQEFADWLKSTVDKLAVMDGPIPVALVLVAMEERRQQLIQNVPSLSRVFDLLSLQPWPQAEAEVFFSDAFQSVELSVDAPALDTMARYCGGLPTLAHEIGDAVFSVAAGAGATTVTRSHAIAGLVHAAEVIGRKYIGPQVLEAIRSETYRSTLTKLGRHGNPFQLEFNRAEFLDGLDEKEKRNLDNFLRRMKDLGLISSAEDRGSYRFVSHLARVFLWLEAGAPVVD